MSRLSAPPLFALLLASSAQALAASPTEVARAPHARWDLDSRLGYGHAFTTGQSFLGFGTGLAAGVGRAGGHPHLELGLTHYPGSIASASNATYLFWSRAYSTLGHVALGYEFEPYGFVLRPELAFGAAFVSTRVRLGPETRRDLDTLALFGFGGAALRRWRGLHAGLSGHAYFVPSRVAAPVVVAAAVFGVSR